MIVCKIAQSIVKQAAVIVALTMFMIFMTAAMTFNAIHVNSVMITAVLFSPTQMLIVMNQICRIQAFLFSVAQNT